jgi:hypothetical protein
MYSHLLSFLRADNGLSMKKISLFISILYCTSALVVGQDISVTADFDTSRISIGDQIGFTVTVSQPVGLSLPFPQFRDTLIKNIEVLSGPVIDTSVVSDKAIKVTGKYLVTSFDSGLYKVDPVYVELKNEQGIRRFYSDYSVLEVNRVRLTPPDTVNKIFDIVRPYSAPVTLAEILPWVLLIIVTAVLIWLLIRFLKKFHRVREEAAEPALKEPAHVIAFRELELLRKEELWQLGETKKYYTRLTEILRKYLENRFGVFSLELTTSETLDALVKTGFRKDESYNLLKSVLNGADLVKFAKYQPEAAENESGFNDSWNFVSVTKKEETALEAGEANDKKKEGKV